MPKAASGGALWKKVFFKILQNSQETSVPEETPMNFEHLTIQLFWVSAQTLVTFVSLMYQVHEFFFRFLV